MLTKDNIIWSKGPIRNNTYYSKETEEPSSVKDIQTLVDEAKNVIFIRNGSMRMDNTPNINDLDYFAILLHRLKEPVILVTSDGDRPVPSSYSLNTITKILMSNKIKMWYTQNYDQSIRHPKLKHLPIGFDLHSSHLLVNDSIDDTMRFWMECRKNSPTNIRFKNRIYCDSHLSLTHPERLTMFNILKDNKYIDFNPSKISFMENTKNYNKYNFALSPRGNGVDCHRTWELFLSGVIVITKTSPLDQMFISNNLPVVILNDWNELNDVNLEKKLQLWYDQHIHKTSINNILPKLTVNYWLK